ncbi:MULTISPECIES: RagB/SusD family nutrient uptake outer membrane protein [Sphingobacterium]|uniref:RagB/SusD family nutrient uptake outer membrane protein n=1 Tax=Sphingobacterium TaxID=28453 RepID=UPI0013DAF667|nr:MULTISPECIES: RagB/SusD family nutrient uptake outer membrane protein [unclassified Sphingobacterium]
MKNLFKLFFLLPIVIFSGCEKFLDVRPNNTGAINPRTVTDFEEILNNAQLAEGNYFLADLVSDDVHLTDGIRDKAGNNSYHLNTYMWNDKVWDATDEDLMYNDTYKYILQVNIVLDNIMAAIDGSEERKAIAQAQAYIHRAYYYSQLAGIYGREYNLSTADQDLSVPLILHPDANELPERATVKQVYNQILSDLKNALEAKELPDFGVDILHPGKAAAYALLARIHLMMGHFDEALLHAESALSIRDTLLDYRLFSFVNPSKPALGVKGKLTTLEEQKTNPELLFGKVTMDTEFYNKFTENLEISKGLLELYQPKDLRLAYNFVYTATNQKAVYPFFSKSNTWYTPFNYSIGVPEMMLIKAECLARTGREDEAIAVINHLRKYRFKTVDFMEIQVGVEDPLKLVFEERRRELYLKGGLRLFDLKRLNREGKYVTTMERLGGTPQTVIKTLPALSPRYLMPFAPKLIANNNLIIQNNR